MADTWTWDEAACRARQAAVASFDATESSCLSFSAHALSDLRAALAALDAARAEVARLGQLVCDFRAASLLEAGGGDPAGVTPAHVERHVTELRAEIDRLRAALEPFARAAARFDGTPVSDDTTVCPSDLTIRHCRRAAAALGGDSDG